MESSFGAVYKKIRKSKGLSQKEICGDKISRTSLSKIENAHTSPSYEMFTYLLEKINMSADEFEYIRNSLALDQRKLIINRFFNRNINLNNDLDKEHLKTLLAACEAYLENDHDQTIEEISITIKALKELDTKGAHNHCLPTVFVSKIWARLSNAEVWYYYDLRLLNCILFYLPIETVQEVAVKAIEQLDFYEDFKDINFVKAAILINITSIYLSKNLLNEAKILLDWSYKLAMKQKRYDFLAISLVRSGICKSDNALIDRGLGLLELVDDRDLMDVLQREVAFYC